MKALLLAAASAVAFSTSAFAQDWVLDTEASSVTANLMVFNSPVTDSFERFDADITLDPNQLDTASIEAVVYSASGVARNESGREISDYQNALEGSSGLDVANHEAVRFTSTSITATDNGYDAAGTLTLRDVTRDVVLSFTLDITGDRAVAQGGFTLSREDLGLVNSSWGNNIADTVELTLHIEADRGSADGEDESRSRD